MTSEPQVVARSLAFRHGADISRLRAQARMHPWQGREAVQPRHRMVVPAYDEPEVRVSLLLTLDNGYHSSGWWRNSDYDRCFHLSMTAMNAELSGYEEIPDVDRRAWPRAFFGDNVAIAWWEPPASAVDPYRNSKASPTTWHVRLFLDRNTGRPIKPEGEVYNLKPWVEGDSPAKVFR